MRSDMPVKPANVDEQHGDHLSFCADFRGPRIAARLTFRKPRPERRDGKVNSAVAERAALSFQRFDRSQYRVAVRRRRGVCEVGFNPHGAA